eukprot:7244252-Alexandrium_andersonii.AAC.1
MSASLVGSEMCIRDSPALPFSSPSPGGLQSLIRGFWTWAQVTPTRIVPVSYTHLTLPTICSV